MENDPEWKEQGNCAGTGVYRIFFPTHGSGEDLRRGRPPKDRPKNDPFLPAKKVCARCVVIAQCLDYAIETNQEYGVWGGLDPVERRKVRRRKLREKRESK